MLVLQVALGNIPRGVCRDPRLHYKRSSPRLSAELPAQTAIEFYGKFGFTRTQHMVTNVVVQRTGETTAIMRSYALAIHVYPDESVWNATVKYLDDVHYSNGQWKFVHRRVTLTSLTTAPAWAGAP